VSTHYYSVAPVVEKGCIALLTKGLRSQVIVRRAKTEGFAKFRPK
jgi:hypothetical protein